MPGRQCWLGFFACKEVIMSAINTFINTVIKNNYDIVAIDNLKIVEGDKMVRCRISPWDGSGVILQHIKNSDGNWDELGTVVAAITIEDDDNISIQLF